MAGRHNKYHLDWFKMDVAMDTKIELLEAEFGLKGFAIFVKLLQRIYGGQGYYCEWNEEVRLLFSRRVGEGCNLVSEVVDSAIKRGLFDQTLYEKYSILTSEGIQERYLDAINKRGSIEMKKEYLLVHGAQNLKNVVINSINDNKNLINNVKNTQNRIEQNRTEKNNNKPGTECSEQVVFRMPLKDNTEFDITESQYTEFVQAYPEVDINQELKKMRVWCNSNPTKKKTKRGVMRFINSWLDRVTKPPQYPQTGTGEKYDYSAGGDTF